MSNQLTNKKLRLSKFLTSNSLTTVAVQDYKTEIRLAIQLAERLVPEMENGIVTKKDEWKAKVILSVPYSKRAVENNTTYKDFSPWWVKAIIRNHVWRNQNKQFLIEGTIGSLREQILVLSKRVVYSHTRYLKTALGDVQSLSERQYAYQSRHKFFDGYTHESIRVKLEYPQNIIVDIIPIAKLEYLQWVEFREKFQHVRVNGRPHEKYEAKLKRYKVRKQLYDVPRKLWWNGRYAKVGRLPYFSEEFVENEPMLEKIVKFLGDTIDPRILNQEEFRNFYLGRGEETYIVMQLAVQEVEIYESNIELCDEIKLYLLRSKDPKWKKLGYVLEDKVIQGILEVESYSEYYLDSYEEEADILDEEDEDEWYE